MWLRLRAHEIAICPLGFQHSREEGRFGDGEEDCALQAIK